MALYYDPTHYSPPAEPQGPSIAEVVDELSSRYDDLAEEDFHGEYCACGRRMHASDTECERCWFEREHGGSV